MKPKPKVTNKKVTNISSLLIEKKVRKTKAVPIKQEDNVPLEFDEQCRLIDWCNNHPDQRLKLIYSHLNGVYTSAKVGAKAAMAGAKAGLPDLFLPVSNNYFGLYIELKRCRGGVVSPKQKEWIAALQAQGYLAVVCAGA